jgi:excisionase family DNA binding protein
MAQTQTTHLTVPQVAGRLGLTADGVYKLIQRGKLEAERLSARKTTVSEEALARYVERQQAAVDRFREQTPTVVDVGALREQFERETGRSPEDWMTTWKGGAVADTPENMGLLVRAAALRDGGDGAPVERPSENPWALPAVIAPRARTL